MYCVSRSLHSYNSCCISQLWHQASRCAMKTKPKSIWHTVVIIISLITSKCIPNESGNLSRYPRPVAYDENLLWQKSTDTQCCINIITLWIIHYQLYYIGCHSAKLVECVFPVCCLSSVNVYCFYVAGGLFHPADDKQEIAFRYAVEKINSDRSILPRSKLSAQIEKISPQDSFHASKRGTGNIVLEWL